MAELKENLLDWLRDAHAMEQQAETISRGRRPASSTTRC